MSSRITLENVACVYPSNRIFIKHEDVFKLVALTEQHFAWENKIKRTWLVCKLHDG